jgi:hypothetical protein
MNLLAILRTYPGFDEGAEELHGAQILRVLAVVMRRMAIREFSVVAASPREKDNPFFGLVPRRRMIFVTAANRGDRASS